MHFGQPSFWQPKVPLAVVRFEVPRERRLAHLAVQAVCARVLPAAHEWVVGHGVKSRRRDGKSGTQGKRPLCRQKRATQAMRITGATMEPICMRRPRLHAPSVRCITSRAVPPFDKILMIAARTTLVEDLLHLEAELEPRVVTLRHIERHVTHLHRRATNDARRVGRCRLLAMPLASALAEAWLRGWPLLDEPLLHNFERCSVGACLEP